jgi:hypothetical protein
MGEGNQAVRANLDSEIEEANIPVFQHSIIPSEP